MATKKRYNQSTSSTEIIPYIIFGISMSFGSSSTSLPVLEKKIYPVELRDPKYYGSKAGFTQVSNQNKYSLDRLQQNKSIITSLGELGNNWNGYGGEPISSDLIENIKNILSEFEIQPQIFPTGRGSIQLDFFKSDDNLLEIEISSDGVFAFKKVGDREEEFDLQLSEIIPIANEFNG